MWLVICLKETRKLHVRDFMEKQLKVNDVQWEFFSKEVKKPYVNLMMIFCIQIYNGTKGNKLRKILLLIFRRIPDIHEWLIYSRKRYWKKIQFILYIYFEIFWKNSVPEGEGVNENPVSNMGKGSLEKVKTELQSLCTSPKQFAQMKKHFILDFLQWILYFIRLRIYS